MKPSISTRDALILVLAVAATLGVAGGVDSITDAKPDAEPWPDSEMNVSCYKWVENGTANVICPDKVFAPNRVVNITVKGCGEYRFANDEPHPCGDYRG